ncbi:MAG: 50S ribosomal protein L5 [Candidatus Wildermuthbacteria bacterium]|nr:50S ribosomal protein L5 [Candidatus Wildermuthbacteria bacterium]
MTLQERYKKQAVPAMMQKFGYKNALAVPRLVKIVVNTGFGKAIAGKTGEDLKKILEDITRDLSLLTGQKPAMTRSKKSISGFKLRQGIAIGAKVTLRGKRMYDFADRLVNIVLPRSRDFRGIPAASFDKNGNLSIGIKEHVFFIEVPLDKVRHTFGLEITLTANSKNREQGRELFKLLGFPIQ